MCIKSSNAKQTGSLRCGLRSKRSGTGLRPIKLFLVSHFDLNAVEKGEMEKTTVMDLVKLWRTELVIAV